MEPVLVKKLEILKKRFYELQNLSNNSDIINSQQFYSANKKYARLFNIVQCFDSWLTVSQKIIHIKAILPDADLYTIAQNELKEFQTQQINLEKKIQTLVLSHDPHDNYGCFIELRAGTGGKEAAVFTGELFRMYSKYAEIHKWKVEIIHITYGEHGGGYKEIIAKISYNGTYQHFKFESGGHRVQRIPSTESQGRIHTSTCTVAIIPIVPNTNFVNINPNDLRIDTFRSSGAGGQHVNTTDSAIRITHIPTGLSVECQDERSQHKNKAKALSVLSARLYAIDMKRRQKIESDMRRNLIGTGERSDRIRTYNFPQNRVTDHRISFTSYKLNDVINGRLDILTQPIMRQHYINLLNQLAELK